MMTGRESNKTYISDKKMLILIDTLKSFNKIKYDIDFCNAIGLRKQNLTNIKNGINHFTPEHIEKVITLFKVNANWIFGISNKVFIDNKKGLTQKKEREKNNIF